MLTLDQSREFSADRDAEFFAALPAHPGVILIEMVDAASQPYSAQTADIRRAAERLLALPAQDSKRLTLRDHAARIRYRLVGSKFERAFTYYQLARAMFPEKYRDRLRIRPPALLKVNLRNRYPRCYVTRGLRADEGFYLGPFPSRRLADAFNEGVLDLFKIRRCQIKIRRDPTFPGCVYSEMKMCMAPCFAGCTKEEYDADVLALVSTLDTRGQALVASLEREREAASEALDFERAAALHKRVEKVQAALRPLPDIARPIDQLDAVILQRGTAEKTVIIFPLLHGTLAQPICLNFADIGEPRSVEATLREALEPSSQAGRSGGKDDPQRQPATLGERYGLQSAAPDLGEHLWLVSRWFYSKPREGEILFRDGDWPYRRLLRACSRILAPPSPVEPPAAPSPEPPAH